MAFSLMNEEKGSERGKGEPVCLVLAIKFTGKPSSQSGFRATNRTTNILIWGFQAFLNEGFFLKEVEKLEKNL